MPQKVDKAFIKNIDVFRIFLLSNDTLSKCFWQKFWRKNWKIIFVQILKKCNFRSNIFPAKQGWVTFLVFVVSCDPYQEPKPKKCFDNGDR